MTAVIERRPYLVHELHADQDDRTLVQHLVPEYAEWFVLTDAVHLNLPPSYTVVYQPVDVRTIRSGLMRCIA